MFTGFSFDKLQEMLVNFNNKLILELIKMFQGNGVLLQSYRLPRRFPPSAVSS